jgi:sulfatase modifying factor 1
MRLSFWFLISSACFCLTTLVADTLPPDMVLIPAGTFQMGNGINAAEGEGNELPVHTVTLDSFAIGKYEITNGQYCEFLKAAYPSQLKVVRGDVSALTDSSNYFPYCSTSSANPGYPAFGEYSQIAFSNNTFIVQSKVGKDMTNHPMVCVSWYGAVAYCNWRSQQEGKQPCYDLSTWNCDFTKKGYRLATEAEWEYAARGGQSSYRFPWGNTITHSQANYYSNSAYSYDISPTRGSHPTWTDGIKPYTSEMGSFPPNTYGLSDMIGNVWEWCNDWYLDAYYSISPNNNPTGPTIGNYREGRGGGWWNGASGCRISFRNYSPPVSRGYGLGFRVVLGMGLPPVVKPSFVPEGGIYDESKNVIITCTTPDAVIHYTTNGNDPTENDPIVASGGSVTVDHSLTLNAKAWKTGHEPSDIGQATYTIDTTDQQTIAFGKKDGKSMVWMVRKANNQGPAYENRTNNWSSKKSCVELLEDGLHLRIRQINGQWYCSEIFTNESLGYGVYKFTVATNTPFLDPRTVVGLFTYDKNYDAYKNEIDIELTQWADSKNQYNAQHAIYIPNNSDPNKRPDPEVRNKKQLGKSFTLNPNMITQNSGFTTHVIDWNYDRVILESYYGSEPLENNLKHRYVLSRSNPQIKEPDINYPVEGPENAHINFWLYDADLPISPPSVLQEVVIQNFEFTKRQSVQNSDFENTTLDGWTIEGPGTAKITEDPSNPTNHVCELTTGSPVSLKQNIQTPPRGFKILFDHRFLTPTGFLEIYLNSHFVGSVKASAELQSQMTGASLRVIDPTLCGLEDSELVLKFDGPSGSQMLIDNVILETLPAIDGDHNEDCRVNILDLSSLSLGWEQTYHLPDLITMVEHWLSECSF